MISLFLCIEDRVDYDNALPSHADTLNRIPRGDGGEDPQVLAVFAYHPLPLPEIPPRQTAESRGH